MNRERDTQCDPGRTKTIGHIRATAYICTAVPARTIKPEAPCSAGTAMSRESEERRVGKECRTRLSPNPLKKKRFPDIEKKDPTIQRQDICPMTPQEPVPR